MQETFYIQKSASSVAQISFKSKLLQDRIIFLDTEVDKQSIESIYQQMLILSMEDSKAPITIMINSPGGSVNEGLLLIDFIKSMPMPVRTICCGMAASMGAVILAAGSERYVLEHSQVMIHEPLIGGNGATGSCSSIEATSKSLIKTKKTINKMLSEFTGKTIKEINKATSFDNYMTSKEAVEFGLCDKIIKDNELFNILTR